MFLGTGVIFFSVTKAKVKRERSSFGGEVGVKIIIPLKVAHEIT